MKNIRTPPGRLSYGHLVKPEAPFEGADPRFSLVLVLEGKTDITKLEEAVKEAAIGRFGSHAAKDLESGKIRNPIRTEWEAKGYPEGSCFISAKSKKKPGMVHAYNGPDGKPKRIEDEDVQEELYPGCDIHCSVDAFAYSVNGNRGVSFALNNLQKLGDNERLDGRLRAEDEFEATETEPVDMGA